MERYSIITNKNPREILLLRGSGCQWRKCAFCDYHLDSCPDEKANFALYFPVIQKVTGEFKHLEIINSGSFSDLDGQTEESMKRDIELGLEYFDRVCVNVMCENSTEIKPNKDVIRVFVNNVMPVYVNSPRVDILLENTDFGVGE